MKSILLLLISLFTLQAFAVSENDVLNSFAQNSNLQRAAQSFELCGEIMAQWPGREYETRIQNLGAAWSMNPEAAYHILSTCQTIWISRFLDPIKSVQIKRQRDRSKLGFYISALDFVDSYRYLREEIRLFLTVKPDNGAQNPPSPYEVLSGLASSERQMDETLQTEMRSAVSMLAATGGTLAVSLRATKTFMDFTRARSLIAARAAKQALFITVLAWGAGEIAERGLWQVRQTDLVAQTENARKLLLDGRVPRSIALEEFYKAVERLGYFYTYSLYLKESGADAHPTISDNACGVRLRDYFADQRSPFSGQNCRDAANLWIGASQFLHRSFPADAEVQLIAERLQARAKRTFWSFEETRSYLETLPVCVPQMDPYVLFRNSYQCIDPKTGNAII